MRKFTLAVAAATMTVPVAMTVPIESAEAQRYSRHYDRQGYYNGPTWRDRRGRYRCRRPDGTTGLIIGGAAGALLGREVAGRGDRTLGTIVGGAAGALIGREVERGRGGRRCR
jgi:outer membrane lipoprotein SlyB